MKPKKQKHILRYIVLAVILLAVLVLTLGTLKQSKERNKFENTYSEIPKPISLVFKSKNCILGNIDTADYCGYYYSTNNPNQSALELSNSAKQAGYDVHALTRPNSVNGALNNVRDGYVATNNPKGIKLRIESAGASLLLVEVFSSSIQRDAP